MTQDDFTKVKPVTPRDWTKTLALSLATPIVNPGGHPDDPDTVWCPPINSVGRSGIAKSARIKQLAKAMGLKCHVVFAATKSPAAFEGAAVVTPHGIVLESLLGAVRQCLADGHGFIFFDEVNGATPRTQAALLSAMNDRQVGDQMLPLNVRMALAMNPMEDAAGATTLTPPMANRMGHVWYNGPTREETRVWYAGEAEELPSMVEWEALVRKNWARHWATVSALFRQFIYVSTDKVLNDQPDADDPRSAVAWPSNRTWHWAMCAATARRCIGLEMSVEEDIVSAYVGEGAALPWATWVAEADLPSPEDIMAGKWSVDTRRPDRVITAIEAFANYTVALSDDKSRVVHATRAWDVLKSVADAGMADMVIAPAQRLAKARLHGRDNADVALTKAATPVLALLGRADLARYA